MPYKTRNSEKRLRELSKHFKGILLVGARQVGKTTLLHHLFPEARAVTFDPIQDLYGARRDPDLFLDNFPPPLILDEIQYAPELLPALKRRMDTQSGHGQYYLSGSQQLALLKDVTESLAGRVAMVQLGPMTPLERLGFGGTPAWVEAYLDKPDAFAGQEWKRVLGKEEVYQALWRGQLPGTLDLPDTVLPDYYQSYVGTYIERDVRRQGGLADLAGFSRLVGLAAALTAQEVNASQFGREVGVSPRTARLWLDILAACYQWRELPAYHGNAVKRVSGRPKGYLGDTGLACWLQRISSPVALAGHPLVGSVFETMVVNSLVAEASILSSSPRAWHWRSTGGAEVDLLFERDGSLYPIEVKCKTNLSGHDLRGLHAFRETYGKKVRHAVIVYAGTELLRVAPDIVAVPWLTVRA